MNRDSDMEASESIHKCQKSIFYRMQEAELGSAARAVDSVHATKNMGCVVNVCTHKQLMGGTSEAFAV